MAAPRDWRTRPLSSGIWRVRPKVAGMVMDNREQSAAFSPRIRPLDAGISAVGARNPQASSFPASLGRNGHWMLERTRPDGRGPPKSHETRPSGEPPRVSWKLHFFKGWSHGKSSKEAFTPKYVSEPCVCSRSTCTSTRHDGQRCSRSPGRSAARPRRCARGYSGPRPLASPDSRCREREPGFCTKT